MAIAVIAIKEAEHAEGVMAEQAQSRRVALYLVNIEQEREDTVSQPVATRSSPLVDDCSDVNGGVLFHAEAP